MCQERSVSEISIENFMGHNFFLVLSIFTRWRNYSLNFWWWCWSGCTIISDCLETHSWLWDSEAKSGVIFCRRWSKGQKELTHLLKHFVQLLQGWTHGPVAAHTACITIEVDVGHPIQSVVTESADHRGPHRPAGLLVVGRLIQIGIVCSIDMLVPVRLIFIHHKSWERCF